LSSKFLSELEIQKAAKLARESMLTSLPNEAEGEFSPEFEQKIVQLKKFQKKQEKQLQVRKRFISAAAALLVAVTMLFTFSTEARAVVITWFKDVYSTHVVYWFNGETAEHLPVFELAGVPEEFACVKYETLTYSRSMLYQNVNDSKDMFSLEYALLQEGAPLTVDTSSNNYTVTEITVAGYVGNLYISSDPLESHALIWIDEANGVVFTITTLGDPNIMLHIAEAIKLVK
jgi:hypothetical protein